jgi:hypothetical protein
VPRFESLLNRRPSAVKFHLRLIVRRYRALGAVVYQEMHEPPEKDRIVFGYKVKSHKPRLSLRALFFNPGSAAPRPQTPGESRKRR